MPLAHDRDSIINSLDPHRVPGATSKRNLHSDILMHRPWLPCCVDPSSRVPDKRFYSMSSDAVQKGFEALLKYLNTETFRVTPQALG